jgi:hypothetical protein
VSKTKGTPEAPVVEGFMVPLNAEEARFLALLLQQVTLPEPRAKMLAASIQVKLAEQQG